MPDLSLDGLFGGAQDTATAAAPATSVDLDSLFGAPHPVKTGALADFAVAAHASGRVLNAFKQGAVDSWGASAVQDKPVQAAMGEGWNAFADQQGGLLKGFNEAVLRPAAAVLDRVWTAPSPFFGAAVSPQQAVNAVAGALPAAVGGVQAGLQQTQEEAKAIPGIPGAVLSSAAGGASELLDWAASTGAPEFATPLGVPQAARELDQGVAAADLAHARSLAVVGEGEEGYFGTVPPTPEDLEVRATAAQEAGQPLPPQPPPPTVHELARKVDPETFVQWDALAAEKEAYRTQITEATSARSELPEAVAAQADIDTILGKVNGVQARLTGMARDRLAAAQDALDAVLHTDTPELAALRGKLMDVDFAMRDLAPDVSQAYRHAQDLMPEPEAVQASAEGAEAEGEGRPTEAEGAAQRVTPVPEGAAEPTGGAPNVVGDETLGAPTPPPEPGTVRLYHGGAPDEDVGPLWVTRSLQDAEGWASRNPSMKVWHVDVPEAELETAVPGAAGDLPNWIAPLSRFELPEDLAKGRKPFVEAAQQPVGEGAAPSTKGRTGGAIKPVEGTGELRTRGLSEGIEAKAVEEGLTDTFGDLPEYRQLSMTDQAVRAGKIVEADYEGAKAIAMGRKAPPAGVLPESVLVAVEKRAIAEGDVETLRQLATASKLTAEATTMGQRIRTLGERDPASPIAAIQAVQDAREADLARRSDLAAAKEAEVAGMKAAIRSAASPKPTWASFIDTITCAE